MPVGFSGPSSTAPIGVPIGMEILGMPWTEGRLLEVAGAIDARVRARRAPTRGGMNESAEVTSYSDVPVIRPDNGNINTTAYPIGRISK